MRPELAIAVFVSVAMLCITSCRAPAETALDDVPSLEGDFERATLTIESDDGLRHEFDVYLANTPDQQRRGLMFVRKMPETTGMLFTYEDTAYHSMWMKNTYISLDLIFARLDGSISSVIHAAQPLSLTSRGSIEPVNYVLELNAGVARKLNIGNRSRLILNAGGD